MKKRISSLLLLWIMVIVHPSYATFDGFRIGGMLGVQLLQGRHWYTPHNPYVDGTNMVRRLSVLSALYGAHAGYLLELGSSKIVVGGEVYAFIPQATPKLDLALMNGSVSGTKEASVTINHNRSIGFALTAGMMMNPKVLAYLSAGMELARFRFTYEFNSAALPPLTSQKQVFNHTFKAINIALGGTYKISPHLLAGLELSSPFFKRFKPSMIPGQQRAYTYKPVERRLIIKLTYLF